VGIDSRGHDDCSVTTTINDAPAEVSRMVPSGAEQHDSLEADSFERIKHGQRPIFPCQGGTPKRTRFKKGAKKVRQNGKHRRRVRKIDW
jgi:hypothetical protein